MSMVAPALAADLRAQLLARLPLGHERPMPAATLAQSLNVSERMIGALVADLIDVDGYLVGSMCAAGASGYFLIQTSEDLSLGTSHTRARAAASFRRIARLEQLARERFADPEVLRLFTLDDCVGPSTVRGASKLSSAPNAAQTPGASSATPVRSRERITATRHGGGPRS